LSALQPSQPVDAFEVGKEHFDPLSQAPRDCVVPCLSKLAGNVL